MNFLVRFGKFLSRCYHELKTMYWPNVYDLQLYCVVVMLFIFSLCAVTIAIDLMIKYSLDYIFN